MADNTETTIDKSFSDLKKALNATTKELVVAWEARVEKAIDEADQKLKAELAKKKPK
jgi:hypothetical protein